MPNTASLAARRVSGSFFDRLETPPELLLVLVLCIAGIGLAIAWMPRGEAAASAGSQILLVVRGAS